MEFLKNLLQAPAHGVEADGEAVGDLLVGEAAAEQLENLLLPARKGILGFGRLRRLLEGLD